MNDAANRLFCTDDRVSCQATQEALAYPNGPPKSDGSIYYALSKIPYALRYAVCLRISELPIDRYEKLLKRASVLRYKMIKEKLGLPTNNS